MITVAMTAAIKKAAGTEPSGLAHTQRAFVGVISRLETVCSQQAFPGL